MSRRGLVSVVIPAYGRPQHLREAIHSVLAGGYSSVEVVVIDDGSPESILESLSEFTGSGIVRYHRQENAGTAAARNTGARIAEGEYLLFLDDDDTIVPDSIRWRAEALEAHPEVDGVFGRFITLTDDPELKLTDFERPLANVDHWDFMSCNLVVSPGQSLIRRAAFLAVAGFKRDLVGTDDWDLWLRLTSRRPLLRISEIVLNYRVHAGNFSRKVDVMTRQSLRVANIAEAHVCARHRPVAAYMLYGYVHGLHGEKLRRSLPALLRQGALATAARNWTLLTIAAAYWLRARVAFKLMLIRHERRWRGDGAPEHLFGRGCPRCLAIEPAKGSLELNGVLSAVPRSG